MQKKRGNAFFLYNNELTYYIDLYYVSSYCSITNVGKYTKEKIGGLKRDRRDGQSIQYLMRKYDMPKTTVWHHVHDIPLSTHHLRALRSNQGGSRRRKEEQTLKARLLARQMLAGVDVRKVGPIILAALYWAEGNKREFVFTNTDEKMVQIFLHLLRKHWRVEDSRIQLMLRLTGDMNHEKCIKYWSTQTGITPNQIVIDINSVQNKTKTTYGICRVVVKKGGFGLKLTHAIVDEITSSLLKPVNMPL